VTMTQTLPSYWWSTVDKASTKDDRQRIDRLLRKQERLILQAFNTFVKSARSRSVIRAVERTSNIENVLELVDSYIVKMSRTLPQVFQTVAAAEVEHLEREINIAKANIAISFDPTMARAADLMRQNQLQLIREFTRAQRDVTRTALTDAFQSGQSARQAGAAFRDSIGLTSHQMNAVNNYRSLLEEGNNAALGRALRDRRLDSAVRGGAMTRQQIDRAVKGYHDRFVSLRGETIARTEMQRTANIARKEALDQSLEQSGMPDSRVERTWRTNLDGRARDWHTSMNGQKRGKDEFFISGRGARLMYPGDPRAPGAETINCRCSVTIRIKPPTETTPVEPVREEAPASKRFRETYDPKITVDNVIDETPGARKAIKAVERKLKREISTDAQVEDGGHMVGTDWSPTRKKLHKKIVNNIFTKKWDDDLKRIVDFDVVGAATPAAGESPTLTVLGGRAGAGKSFFTKPRGSTKALLDSKKNFVVDNDAIKDMLPEYKGWNAGHVHEEASELVAQVLEIAKERGMNVVLDATMRGKTGTSTFVKTFQKAGYKVDGYFMHTAPHTSTRRALDRFMKGGKKGRYVPLNYVLESTTNEANFDALIAQFRSWGVYDHNVRGTFDLVAEGVADALKRWFGKDAEMKAKKAVKSPVGGPPIDRHGKVIPPQFFENDLDSIPTMEEVRSHYDAEYNEFLDQMADPTKPLPVLEDEE